MRLTKEIKKKIISDVLVKTFSSVEERLLKEENKLAEDVYKKAFSKKEIELMDNAPKGFFGKKSRIRFNSTEIKELYFKEERYFPYDQQGYHNVSITLSPNDTLYKKIEDFYNKIRKNKAEKGVLRRNMNQLLDSCTTLKKLEELWPEGKEFYKNYKLKPVTALVPAGLVQGINAIVKGEGK